MFRTISLKSFVLGCFDMYPPWRSRLSPRLFFMCRPFTHQQSRDQGLDVEPSIAGGPRSMYSSLSTLGRSQYPTLPLGASTSNGLWTPQYPTLARSPSTGGQSDSVFLDGPPDDPSLPPASPGRYCKDPTCPDGSQDDLETDGPNGFHPPHPFHHSLPRRSNGHNHNRALPGEWVIEKKKVA